MKKPFLGFLIFTLSLEWVLRSKHHVAHLAWWEEVPAFFAFFGFMGASLIIFITVFLGKKVLKSDEKTW